MTVLIVNAITLLLLIFSFRKDKGRTKKVFKMAIKKGLMLLPLLLIIIIIIGVMLVFIPREFIQRYLGGEITLFQMVFVLIAGAIAMIPGIIALPLAGSLVDSGASYVPVAAFITTLTMVGFVTIPVEIQQLGKKITVLRNLLAFVFAVIISLLMGVFM